MKASSSWMIASGLLWLAACSSSATSTGDAGQQLDAGEGADAGPLDAGPLDAGSLDAGSTDAGPSSGTLALTISAPAAAAAPVVTVSGPSYLDVLSTSSQLTLLPGRYDVTASPLVTSDPIVGLELLATITGSPATVVAGQTSEVSVGYGPGAVPGTGRLWIADCGGGSGAVYGISTDHLRPDAGTAFAPDITASAPGSHCASGVAFDRDGRLWVGNGNGTDLVAKVYAFELFPDAGSQLSTVLQPDGGWTITSLAFARNGDLWALDWTFNDLYRWTPAQLADALDGGNPSPLTIPTIYYPDGGHALAHATAMAFDRAGNLWLVNEYIPSVVEFEFEADGGFPLFADGGMQAPKRVVVDDGSQLLQGPVALAFDGNGKLWIGDLASDAIFDIDPSALAPDVSAIQPLTIFQYTDGGPRYLHDVSSFTFDNSGAMWITGYVDSVVEIADPGSYSGRAQPPAVLVQGSGLPTEPLSGLSAIVFDPPAPNLYPNP